MAEIYIFQQPLGVRENVGSYQIALSLDSFGKTMEGEILLTPICVTSREWDIQIDRLIARLKQLRGDGKEFLR